MNKIKIEVWSKLLKKNLSPEDYYINGNGDLFLEHPMDGSLVPEPIKNYTITVVTDDKD